MSGNSSTERCPRCNRHNMEVYTDWKPWAYISAKCLDCGFEIFSKEAILDKFDLEDERAQLEFEQEPFSKEEIRNIKDFDKNYGLDEKSNISDLRQITQTKIE